MKLDLTGKQDLDCAALAKSLISSSSSNHNNQGDDDTTIVTELILDRVGIGPSGGRLLSKTLNQTKLITLNLERNALGNVGGRAIGEALATNATLLKLNLSLNDLKAATTVDNGSATQALGDALLMNQTLQELVLVRSALGPKGGTHLAHGLKSNKSLRHLNLTGNDLMAGGGQALGEALSKNATLQNLNLRWNRMGCGGTRGIESLANSLHVNTTLQELDISMNELYSNGAMAFGTALKNNASLTSFKLERNEIGPEGAIAMAEALQQNQTLKHIVLSGNPIIDPGALAIGQALAFNTSLSELELVGCGIGVQGAQAIGRALPSSHLLALHLEKNQIGPIGGKAIAMGVEQNKFLQKLHLSRNQLGAEGGMGFALSLQTNQSLVELDLSSNDIVENDEYHIVQSIADHPTLQYVDLCNNEIQVVPMECQLKMARTSSAKIDLSNNPLSSPPLGRRADPQGLKDYVMLLSLESTAVSRIRLMVLGFGGVGKSTFCHGITRQEDELAHFHASLIPLVEWDTTMIVEWAQRLGAPWAFKVASILEKNKVTGRDLETLISVRNSNEDDTSSSYYPSKVLEDMMEDTLRETPAVQTFARAIGSLMRKGYFSTVGAVKVEGTVSLQKGQRECSLVDFAGQMEYLVSHQLLLSSMYTICMILQPAPSFVEQNKHSGSWKYWSRFLRALGDRRPGSLLLAISQMDKISDNVNAAVENEYDAIHDEIPTITTFPLVLDYRPESIQESMATVRQAMSTATDVVAKDWWVPASYEQLSNLIRQLEEQKHASRELPLISIEQLREELPAAGLFRMHDDSQLLKRGIEYLEAVGDVLTDPRLDCLLLDPIRWFASFLAHFVRDEHVVTSVQLDAYAIDRGVIGLNDVVTALQHDYSKPQEQIPIVMSLVCRLELCVPYRFYNNDDDSEGGEEQYLFPCLLPPATSREVAQHWPRELRASSPMVFRGHRFQAQNGFLPPGLFPALLARCRHLRRGVLDSSRMYNNCAILRFSTKMKVIVRINLEAALLDVVAAAPTAEEIFLGGAKGQASAVIWMAHVIKMFLRQSYPQLQFDEAFLCPSPECHRQPIEEDDDDDDLCCGSYYCGREFPVKPVKVFRGEHSCEADGCWNQLGLGHKLETMVLQDDSDRICTNCNKSARFALRSCD